MSDLELWSEDGKGGRKIALLRAGETLLAKIYLSPDQGVLRIVLPEMSESSQLKIDAKNKLIDFRRKT